jgi:hypothetical protein
MTSLIERGPMMKNLRAVLAGSLILVIAVLIGGCSTTHRYPDHVIYTEVIYVPVPVPDPYPVPVEVESPSPPRYEPLKRPAGHDDSPRTKVAGGDRITDKPVVRDGGGAERPRGRTVAHEQGPARSPARKR